MEHSVENKLLLRRSSVIKMLYRKYLLVSSLRKSPNWDDGHADGESQMCMTETWLW